MGTAVETKSVPEVNEVNPKKLTPEHHKKLNEAFVKARVDEYAKRRKSSRDSNGWMKRFGFVSTVIGTGLILTGQAYGPLVMSKDVIAKIIAAGTVAVKLGLGVMSFGTIKDMVNKKQRP